MVGFCEQLICSGRFHNSSQIHDHNSIADMFYDSEIMTDEQVGEVEIFTKLYEEVKNLCLN